MNVASICRSQAQIRAFLVRWVVQSTITILYGILRRGWRSTEIQVSYLKACIKIYTDLFSRVRAARCCCQIHGP